MDCKKGKLAYNGATKKVYPVLEDDTKIVLHFKDTLDVKNAKQSSVKGKGNVNADMCSTLFTFLNSYHVYSHFIEQISENELLVKKAQPLRIRVIIWNIADKRFSRTYKIDKGYPLEYPVLEYYLKDSSLKDPMISPDYVCAFSLASHDEMKYIDNTSRKINAVLKSFFNRRQLALGAVMLEFGRDIEDGRIILIDEISSDSLYFYNLETGKEFFSGYKNLLDAYKELHDRF